MAVWKNFRKMTIMSIAMFLLYLAYGPSRNYMTKMLKDDGLGSLGFLSASVHYAIYTFSAFFSTAIVNKIGRYDYAMSFGAFGYAIFCISFLLAAFMSKAIANDPQHLIPESGLLSKMSISICYCSTAILCGLGSGVLWTAHGTFVSKAACESNKGFYNGYSWAWVWTS